MSLRVSTPRRLNSACSGLMYSGVPTIWAKPVCRVRSVKGSSSLGHAEVDDLGNGDAIVGGDEHVGRLEIAMDDPLGVGVLDGAANLHEHVEPLPHGQPGLVTVVGDGDAAARSITK